MTDVTLEHSSTSPTEPRPTALEQPPVATAVPTQAPPASPAGPDIDDLTSLRTLENVLVTLATWEDTDDNLLLREPLAGQQALHAVRRLRDASSVGRADVDPGDLSMLREAVRTLAAGARAGDEVIGEAVETHREPGRSHSDLIAQLARL